MPKTIKKKPMSKAAAAALKAMENMVVPTADLEVHIEQARERLTAAGLSVDFGIIAYAGRMSPGSGQVQVNIGSGGFASSWPEWAFGVAEGALHFNKKVLVLYNNQPFGSNLLQVLCTNIPVWPQPDNQHAPGSVATGGVGLWGPLARMALDRYEHRLDVIGSRFFLRLRSPSAMGQSQDELAQLLQVTQGSVAKLEKRTDMYVSTMRRFIEAMGGELEIVARFGQRTVKIKDFADMHREPEITAGMLRAAKAGEDKDDRSPI